MRILDAKSISIGLEEHLMDGLKYFYHHAFKSIFNNTLETKILTEIKRKR